VGDPRSVFDEGKETWDTPYTTATTRWGNPRNGAGTSVCFPVDGAQTGCLDRYTMGAARILLYELIHQIKYGDMNSAIASLHDHADRLSRFRARADKVMTELQNAMKGSTNVAFTQQAQKFSCTLNEAEDALRELADSMQTGGNSASSSTNNIAMEAMAGDLLAEALEKIPFVGQNLALVASLATVGWMVLRYKKLGGDMNQLGGAVGTSQEQLASSIGATCQVAQQQATTAPQAPYPYQQPYQYQSPYPAPVGAQSTAQLPGLPTSPALPSAGFDPSQLAGSNMTSPNVMSNPYWQAQDPSTSAPVPTNDMVQIDIKDDKIAGVKLPKDMLDQDSKLTITLDEGGKHSQVTINGDNLS
jgi:uncharacterized protein YukE